MDISVSFDKFYKEEIAVAENSLSKKTEFLTKYCNIKQSSSVAWLRRESIEAIFGDKYNLDDPLSFDDIALDLTDSIKDFFKFPIKGDITVKFELNEECYIHLIPSP